MEFWLDFGAKDAAWLTPCKDDKPKDAEIAAFQAGSDSWVEPNRLALPEVH